MRLLIRVASGLLLLPLGVPAQQSATPFTYDVVSIRIDTRGPGSSGTDADEGTFTATNVTLKDLLEDAFDIRQDIISGIPGPIDSLRFDVHAKIVDPDREALRKLTDSQRRAMLLPVLTERFGLKAHIETRTLPVYELLLLKDGSKLQRSPDQALGANDQSTSIHNTSLEARNMPLPIFAKTLSHIVHRTVLDKTGLAGLYDLELKWSSDDATDLPADAPPGIVTALPEQLGLKLQPAKGPVETLVVDHVELPTEN